MNAQYILFLIYLLFVFFGIRLSKTILAVILESAYATLNRFLSSVSKILICNFGKVCSDFSCRFPNATKATSFNLWYWKCKASQCFGIFSY